MVAINTSKFDTILEAKCQMCRGDHVLFVMMKDYLSWKHDDGNIEDILTYLTDSERQLLMNKTCGECFDRMFA